MYFNTMLYLRCMFAWLVFLVATSCLRVAIRLLPPDHPGRIYAKGRWTEGHSRLGRAFSDRAAARYLASRRRRRYIS